MNSFIIPSIVIIIIIYGLYSGVNIYESFTLGVLEGIKLIINIFPTIFSFVIAVNIFINSNIINDFSNFFKIVNIQGELLSLSILRPVSGSSSLIVLNSILKKYGADSLIGRIASVIQGGTDTTIYIIGLYFSSVGVTRLKYALIVGLLTDLVAVFLSIVVINILF